MQPPIAPKLKNFQAVIFPNPLVRS